MHLPYHDLKTLRAVEAYMRDHRWDGWLLLGDFLDLDMLSSFEREHPEVQSKPIKEVYDMANEFLDIHQEIVRAKNPNAKMVYLEGNHEERIQRELSKYPKLRGLIEIPSQLKLKERKIDWVPSWSKGKTFKKGKCHFRHGWRTQKYHSFHTAVAHMAPVYYGHCHDVQEVAHQSLGHNDVIVGKSLGCLCNYDQSYLKGNPTAWQQAFAVFMFHKDGFFTEHTIRIFKHRFTMPNGVTYDGRKL